MSKLKDLTGMKFGRLTVIERAENTKEGRARWLCLCDCGNTCVIEGKKLRNGHSKSCGCFKKEQISKLNRIHGMTHTRSYHIWQGIKRRCLNPHDPAFYNYGDRGITMYPAWINDFQAFYDYVSTLKHFDEEGYSLDRINNVGNYEPNNLRWADRKTQNRNQRTNIIVEYNGESMTLVEAAELSGINYGTLYERYYKGDIGERLFRPVRQISR